MSEMPFVDNLGLELMTLPVVSLLLIYMTARAYLQRKSEDFRRVKNVLSEGAAPLLGLGLVIIVLALWGEATWTLPGSYNILFNDAYLLLGLTITVFSASLLFGKGVTTSGVLGAISGLITIWYGLNGYWLGLTKEPLALLGIYGLFGLASIAGYPAARILDKWVKAASPEAEVPARQGIVQPNPAITRATSQVPSISLGVSGGWLLRNQIVVMGIFWVLMIAAGLLSGYVAFSTIPAHLASPP